MHSGQMDMRMLQKPGAVCAYRTRTQGIVGFTCLLPLNENCLSRLNGDGVQRCSEGAAEKNKWRAEPAGKEA